MDIMKIHSLHKPLILSVDDDPDILFATRAVMQSRGYEVRSSLNGENIWALLGKELPDVILMDIQMKGINGDTICSLLKNSNVTRDIPVIILSGNDDIEQLAKRCGADAFVRKPFTGSEIDDCIVKLIGRYRA